MMSKILLLFSSREGHTRKVCEYIRDAVLKHNKQLQIDVKDFHNSKPDLEFYDCIIVGASIHYGKHHTDILPWIAQNQALLETRISGFFSINLVARKPEKNQADTNPYLKKIMHQCTWKPDLLAVFAGRVDYPSYAFWDK